MGYRIAGQVQTNTTRQNSVGFHTLWIVSARNDNKEPSLVRRGAVAMPEPVLKTPTQSLPRIGDPSQPFEENELAPCAA
jgi:hypothetical protein